MTGVDLFFVLSGFLIIGILFDARNSPSYYRTFYARRFFRIVPIYYLWIVLFLVLAWVRIPHVTLMGSADLRPQMNWGIWRHFLFLQNLWFTDYAGLAAWWFGPTWSLAVEEQFYLVTPVVVRHLSKQRLLVVLASVVLGALGCRVLIHRFLAAPEWPAYAWMPCRADALALGGISALLWRDNRFRETLTRNKPSFYGVFGVLLLGIAVLGTWFASPNGLLTQTVGYTWIASFYACLLLLVLADTTGPIARVARMPWLRGWGRISYCVYLIHAAVKYFCFRILHADPSHLTSWRSVPALVMAIAITYVVAKLS